MFRTEVYLEPAPQKISLHHPILCIGSCFAQVIGQRLQSNKFQAVVNPFGTLYNPSSIFQLLHDSINGYMPAPQSYLQREEQYFNFNFHSDFTADSQEDLEIQIGRALQNTRDHLRDCRWIVITLGTALCYERMDNGQIVANCHKMPGSYFNQRMLDPHEIITRFEQLYQAVKAYNENTRFIFTLSPVRHIRDTLVRNSVSKAALRLAIDRITELFPEDVAYFPSYEIMMDDLRDYRFYEADMIHPDKVAQDYIWEKWMETYLDGQSTEFIMKWDNIRKALSHRPFNPSSQAHQRFVSKTIELLEQLASIVDVSDEIAQMKKQLS
jgi:hypothetical protein